MPSCDLDISHKRSNAKYCSRKHKLRASENRRNADGRSAARNKARYAKERERRIKYAREYYWENAEELRQYSRDWRSENRDKRKIQHQRRRARMMGAESREVTHSDWVAIIDRQRGQCYYCPSRGDLVMDHVVPLARGGRHAIGNLVAACVRCNSQKGAIFVAEWRRRYATEEVITTLGDTNTDNA